MTPHPAYFFPCLIREDARVLPYKAWCPAPRLPRLDGTQTAPIDEEGKTWEFHRPSDGPLAEPGKGPEGCCPWPPRCSWRRFPASNIALAQAPPGNEIVLVNADREFVERKGGGEFVARPVFDREIANPFYAVRDADTGDWISAMYRVKGGEKKRSDGWEYSWEYPDLEEHPDLDRDRAYLLVMLAEAEDGRRGDFYAVIPIHQPGRIWDKILSALSPARWAKAFAGWVIEGVHGTLCGVVERASGEDADNCRGG